MGAMVDSNSLVMLRLQLDSDVDEAIVDHEEYQRHSSQALAPDLASDKAPKGQTPKQVAPCLLRYNSCR